MTKEELEKEADKWVKGNTEIIDDEELGMECIKEPQAKEAYLAGAEPREKRIAELEALIHAERKRQEQCDDIHLRKIAELEKENAELKNKLEHRNCLDCSNHSSKLRLRTLELEKEIADAKKLLRRLKSLIEDVCDINYLSKENCKLLVETEQFLIDPDDRFEVTEKRKEYLSSH